MKERPSRKIIQWLMVPMVPLVILGGYFWPYFGFIAIAMLCLMLVMSQFRGRYYCGWFCAMGAFHERVLARLSRKKKMLPLFSKGWFRWMMFVLMIGLLISRLIMSGGDPAKVGAVFVMMWSLSTGLAVAIGLFWKPRSWCSFCPMATFQGIVAPNTYLLNVSGSCKSCGVCREVCPIETDPGSCRDAGVVKSMHCMRCGNCVDNCPQGALSFGSVGGLAREAHSGHESADEHCPEVTT